MKTYELFAIVKPTTDLEEADKLIKKVEKSIKTLGGHVDNVEKMGKKKLAYEINGFKEGLMINLKLGLDEDKIKEFKRQIKLNENIIRTMFAITK